MTTEELVQELNRLRSLTHALTQEIERLLRKVDPASLPSGRLSAAPPGGHAKKIPSLQMPAVRPTSRPPSRPPKK